MAAAALSWTVFMSGDVIMTTVCQQTFGARLKRRREFVGLSQWELASDIGTEQGHISKWEQGKRSPTIRNLYKLCLALKCSADLLLGLTFERRP